MSPVEKLAVLPPAAGARYELDQERIGKRIVFCSTEPADLNAEVDRLDYYHQREGDYFCRNPGAAKQPYYRDYAEKYVSRFAGILDSMTPEGVAWNRRTRGMLQKMVEEKRSEDPATFAAMERSADDLDEFAWETHRVAYKSTHFMGIPWEDKREVWGILDISDLLSWHAMSTVFQIVVWDPIVRFFASLFD